jgi:predicted RNA methylase
MFRSSDKNAGFAFLILVAGLAAAQTAAPRREPDVPYVPTTDAAVHAMLKLAAVTRGDVVYDLGCGDGRLVVAAAKEYGARGVGIDIDPDRIREAKENARKAGVENLTRFEENDLFKVDIHEASVVTLFLLSSINEKLRPKLIRDLRPGTRIVSNTFQMGNWKPDREETVESADEDSYFSRKIYLWLIPRRTATLPKHIATGADLLEGVPWLLP